VARAPLTTRFLLTTTLVLAGCLALSAAVLDRAFAANVFTSAEDQLTLVTYGLLGAADDNANGLNFPGTLPEPRLSQPESGLYATVLDRSGAAIFASDSLRLTEFARPLDIRRGEPGEALFYADDAYFYLSYPVLWDSGELERYDFVVIADRAPFQAAIAEFRRQMMVGAIVVILLLAVAQYLAVLWGLEPIHQMARRVRQLEAGAASRMGDDHPPELTPLAQNIDRLLDHEAATRERYRQGMADLAHSLKTPLAVLRNGLRGGQLDVALLSDQVARMHETIDYQLARAVAPPPLLPAAATPVLPLLQRLLATLDKAYADKCVRTKLNPATNGAAASAPMDTAARVDQRDMMEMLGNLLDNGYKYCVSEVAVTVSVDERAVHVVIDDDGAGVAPELRRQVLERGARADTRLPGQGLGLAVTADIAAGYGGAIKIEDGALGGARITLSVPRAAERR
jgi:two-component system, OmpR family, sensor histidine kinase PhoQ